jgi:RNA polymerase sigma-70 factor (sigma-E family)
VSEGDFAEYVGARRVRLIRTAVLLGCPEADAEDLVQTVLVRCLRSWGRVNGAENRDAYVNRILINTFHSARSRRWNGELPTETLPEASAPDVDHATGIVVRRALAGLSPRHREALVLRYFSDLTERQTAIALGIAPGTVKSRVSRALAALSADEDIASLLAERSA